MGVQCELLLPDEPEVVREPSGGPEDMDSEVKDPTYVPKEDSGDSDMSVEEHE
jgi:hypothetical protein